MALSSVFTLTLKFTSRKSGILNILAICAAVVHGGAWPVFGLLFGEVINAASGSNIADQTRQIALYIFFLGLGVIVTASVWNTLLSRSAIERSNGLRLILFQSLLDRDTEWFDSNGSQLATITAKLNTDVDRFRSAIGVRLGMFVVNLSQGFIGVGLSFINGWQLSLLVTACIPLIAVSTFLLNSSVTVAMDKTESVYAAANALCEESIFAIKTVTAFNGQSKQETRHNSYLETALATIRKVILKLSVAYGLCNASIFITFAIAFAFGGYLVSNNVGGYNAGNVGGTLVMILTGAFGFGQTATGLQAFTDGLNAMKSIDSVLGQQDTWNKIETSTGESIPENIPFESINIRNIAFQYTLGSPLVMSRVSLDILAGQKIAIVGESGSGKSSLVSLLMRFYAPTEGEILLNRTKNLRNLNLSDLRSLFGYVGQEPVLFGGTIRSNLVFGRPVDSVTDAEIWGVLDAVNAAEFVRKLPDQLDTICGQSAGLSHLSGGQKQRIAIARALLRKPKILLLDEATSALDNESEAAVMKALRQIRETHPELTIIAIAHRLSTVKDSDNIFVLGRKDGETVSQIVEQGTHSDLAAVRGGVYATLLASQASTPSLPHTEEPGLRDREETEKGSIHSHHRDQERKSIAKIKPVSALTVFRQIVSISLPRKRRWMYLVGSIGAVAKGVGLPLDAILFSSAIGNFFISNPSDMMHAVGLVSVWYIGLASGVFCGTVIAVYYFSLIGETVKSKLRSVCFSTVIRNKPMDFFDDSRNSPSVVATDISTNSAKAAGFVSLVPRVAVEATATMVAGTLISFLAAPKLAAVLVATFPILFAASAVSMAAWMGADSSTNDAATTGKQDLIRIMSETFTFIKTIRSLQAEEFQAKNFASTIDAMNRAAVWKSAKAGTAFGVAMSCSIFAYSLGYWYGGTLVANGETSLADMLRAVMGPMLTSLGIGEALAFLPDIGESLAGSRAVLQLIGNGHEPHDSKKDDEEKFSLETIKFKDVSFTYPQRPDSKILTGLNLEIPRGKKVALVGPSGSGKSTIFAILQRFYDPTSGQVIVNNELEMHAIDAKKFRSKIGYVGQEPVLFDMSLRENVLYGIENPLDPITESALLEDIRVKANLDFVKTRSDWENSVGPRGSRLSGGQKQRIAIARAIAKDPDMFLFDEATSALDTVSETLIQDSVDKIIASGSKSVVVIAHRLSTVVNSDIIYVIERGRVAEQGTHASLMSNIHSLYSHLYRSGL